MELAPERLLHLVGLAAAHQPGVDEDTRELVADGPVDQRRGHGRVDPTGQGAQHPVAAHLGPHGVDRRFDDVGVGPTGPGPAYVEEEPLEQLLPTVSVLHLGVELHTEDPPLAVLEGGHRRVGRRRRGHETGRHVRDRVGVAHPHIGLGVGGPVGEQRRAPRPAQRGPAVLAASGPADRPPQLGAHQLGAVADPEDRHPELVDPRIEQRRPLGVDRLRPPRQDDPLGPAGGHARRHRCRGGRSPNRRAPRAPVGRSAARTARRSRRRGRSSPARSAVSDPSPHPGTAAAPCPRSAGPGRS